MRVFLYLVTVSFLFISCSEKRGGATKKNCVWNARLKISSTDFLPFFLEEAENNTYYLINAEERILLDDYSIVDDSVHLRFPFFNSGLIFKKEASSFSGYWVNYSKKGGYKMPFSAELINKKRFPFIKGTSSSLNLNGRWKTVFSPSTNDHYPALGVFKQEKGSNSISATFLTETGDYRYLGGNTTKDSLYLSCFDGAHAFLFKAKLIGDTLSGQFFSGNQWRTNWSALKNAAFELESPERLTYTINDGPFEFRLPNLNGDTLRFPSDFKQNKVIIVQVMGTWCPNCLDESRYYKELYDAYHDRGLEIITVCYEVGDGFEDYVAGVNLLKSKLDLDFTFLIGGPAKKGLASEHFNTLNKISSFPTSIFIGKNGQIERVHTGFNGPGTGQYFLDYKDRTEQLLERLLGS